MHSGLLFLFPHMLKVCLAAEKCGHVGFNARTDVWYSSDPFHCDNGGGGAATGAGFWQIYGKVALTAMLWGAGTAAGEIPPYWLSLSAARAGARNEALEEAKEARCVWRGKGGPDLPPSPPGTSSPPTSLAPDC